MTPRAQRLCAVIRDTQKISDAQAETPLKIIAANGEEKFAAGWQSFKSLVETLTANGGKVGIERYEGGD